MSTLAQLKTAIPGPSLRISDEGWDYEVTDQGTTGAIRFIVAGAFLQSFCNILAGIPATTVTIGGTTTTRMIPLQHPRDPLIYAYTSHIYKAPNSIATPGPAGSGWGIDFQWYLADVKFRTPKWSATGDYPMMSYDEDAGMEMRTRPGTAYQFPSDGLRVLHDVGVPNGVVKFALTFEGLTSLNSALYRSLVGTVNSSTFFDCPAGTVLYEGCSSGTRLQIGGVPSWRARQNFSYSRIPHRQIMRPDGTAFEAPVQVGNTSKYLLDESNLNALYA